MKICTPFALLFCLVLVIGNGKAAADKAKPATGIVEIPYEPDYAKSPAERREWHRLRKIFVRKVLPQILRKYREKLRCGNCMDVYMDISFSVSLVSRVNVKSVDRMHACGSEFPAGMQADFIRYLSDYPYPTILLGKSVRLRLGTALKC